MADSIRVNGQVFSFTSLVLKINSVKWHGFTAINYAQKRTRVKLYGMGRHGAPRGRTGGKYEIDPVTVKLAKSSGQQLRRELAQQAPDQKSYGNVEFEMVLQYIDAGEQSVTVEFQGCVIVGESSTNEEGGDPSIEELTLGVMRIVTNGLTLFDSSVQRSV